VPGLLRGVARTAVVAGTATAVAGRVQRRQQGRWAAQEQQQAEAEPAYEEQPPEEAPPASSTDDKLAQLKQLGELRDAGVLTEGEFENQKGKILYG
jgi:hypothetical protein